MDCKKNQEQKKNPLENGNVFAFLCFSWIFKIFRTGYKKELELNDIYNCLDEDNSQTLGNLIYKVWKAENEKYNSKNIHNCSLTKVLAKCFWKKIILIGMWQAFDALILRILQVLLFAKVLNYFNSKSHMSTTEAFYWASGFALTLIVCVFVYQLSIQATTHVELKLRVSCSSLVYRKCLKLSKAYTENQETTVGQIINIFSNDINNFEAGLFGFHYIWIAPIQLIIITIIIYQEMCFYSFLGTFIIFSLIPLQAYIGKSIKILTNKVSLRTDKRLSLLDEIIGGVKVIKMYAWEKPFSRLVDKARKKEVNIIRKIAFCNAFTMAWDNCVSQFCVFVIIFFYVLFENKITAEQIYTIIAFYNIVRTSVFVLMSHGVQRLAKNLVTINRIEEFMRRDEVINQLIDIKNIEKQSHENIAVKIEKTSAKWSQQMKRDTLHNVNFIAERGTLSAIIGQVGSGKSSLLHLIVNELPSISGTIQVSGKIVYASQEPWIFASSIRQNIIFGLSMNKKRYQEVIRVCQLEEDFVKFPFGDKTLIGDRGTTLSGGQKARINLARAIYVDADIYLLDDPLSAVDSHVGKKIFENCICGFLRNKTRILVTHQLQYLKDVDRIFILNNGIIQINGTFNDLQASNLDLLKILPFINDNENVKFEMIDKEEHRPLSWKDSVEDLQEEIPEHRIVGRTSGRVYFYYFKAVGSVWIIFLALFLGIFCQIVTTYGDIFLANWINREDHRRSNSDISTNNDDNMSSLQMYGLLIIASMALTNAFFLILCEMCMRSSGNLHSSMFYSLMRTTMSFFQENPSGRILNRFSKDIRAVDKDLLQVLQDVSQSILLLVAIVLITSIINPWLLVPTSIVAVIFYFLRIIYIRTNRSLKRLEAINRSPIYNHISATLKGLITIRAFRAEQKLIDEFDNYQDLHTSPWYLFFSSITCFTIYLQFICSLYIIIIVFAFVTVKENVPVGNAGLVITQCVLLASMLQWGLKQTTEIETLMTSVERIMEYSDLEQEASLETKTESKPPINWPQDGRVEFKNVSLSYHPSGAPVLRNINFQVASREKIGIVGRTGAGKSSLTSALFRLSYLTGEIYIDGIATSDLGLHDVRSNISIIPQEPLLFTGTLRSNLDPFENYSDDELWQALDEVELKEFIKSSNAGLDAKVSDGGANYSIGQRQLLCLARAIVRKKKILILDEATANVDFQTDELIQKTVRRRFKDCTVFIIAHRLNTVMDCDKFIVMDSGLMVEFGHPWELLKKRGYLYEMVQQTGPDMAQVLMKMTKNV
ncbi:ATP-binding cassette subfamily C member 4-like [Leptopilina boulardi]|uniref:ATP-binding cassette subfamily C member 4-like n=1 Tax=Leptopilina boulardi TaxID=63433 RepID=UPI0021F5A020|nr:ATP-binding cassette subfamily C member 4-like [Leptopilina boulardi]